MGSTWTNGGLESQVQQHSLHGKPPCRAPPIPGGSHDMGGGRGPGRYSAGPGDQ